MKMFLPIFLLLGSFCAGQQIVGTTVAPIQPEAPAAPPSVSTGKSPAPIHKGILIGALDPTGSAVADLNKDQIQILDSGQGATPLMVRKADALPLDLAIVLYADPSTFRNSKLPLSSW